MRPSPLLPVLLLLAACTRAPAPDAPAAPAAPKATAGQTASPPRNETAADIERPARGLARNDEPAQARTDGYGALRFGMDARAMRASWQGPALRGDGSPEDCHYLSPEGQAAPAVLAFMLEGGRFVRYDVGQGNSAVAAPGGGRIGMDSDAIRALYPGIETRPHKYLPEGRVLRVPLEGDAVLVFETGADGNVGAWRVGLPPQVDYVEGCG
jgi:hypothetical protein